MNIDIADGKSMCGLPIAESYLKVCSKCEMKLIKAKK
jgi:hypothetical protein